MHAIQLVDVTRHFGDVVAVNAVNLAVQPGELLTLLGPSGCGKSTTLRLLAGFEQPDGGDILLNGQRVNRLPPEKRATAMVFQHYALWPHKTVFGNVAFGLRVRRVSRPAIRRKVSEVLQIVGLADLATRYPRQLSGGQRQRVALARALAVEPEVLLLDEPLSNLDAQLRVRMRAEIRTLQQRLGITMIYVTHDQEEALSISDKVAVMNAGAVEQIDTPQRVYRQPRSAFVAGFIGHASFLHGQICEVQPNYVVASVDGIRQGVQACYHAPLRPGDRVVLAIKAEDIQVVEQVQRPENIVLGQFQSAAYLGSMTRWQVQVNGQTLQVDLPGYVHQPPHLACQLYLPPEKVIALPELDTRLLVSDD